MGFVIGQTWVRVPALPLDVCLGLNYLVLHFLIYQLEIITVLIL